jgi:hypothetical protein
MTRRAKADPAVAPEGPWGLSAAKLVAEAGATPRRSETAVQP